MLCHCSADVSAEHDKPDWAKKDIRDFSDADMERLFDQWEEKEEELPPEERPEHMRPQKEFDMNQMDINDPESLLKATKKNKPTMVFVNVRPTISTEEVNQLTGLWQTSLQNSHIVCDRYMIDTHRAIFMFRDGSQSWEAKDFLVQQEHVEEVNIENKPNYGKHRTVNTDLKDEL